MNSTRRISYFYLGLFLILIACNKKVELKTKIELSSQMPKWAQLYVDIHEQMKEIQNIQVQIKNNQKEINQKYLLIEDSTRHEVISVYKNRYFQQLSEFKTIVEKSERLHRKYAKDRTLYNYWLNTVQNDIISEEKALEEQKIFEKKYENLRREHAQLRKEFLAFIQKSNDAADQLGDVIPDLVGIRFRVKN